METWRGMTGEIMYGGKVERDGKNGHFRTFRRFYKYEPVWRNVKCYI